jgi:hypothetical protein
MLFTQRRSYGFLRSSGRRPMLPSTERRQEGERGAVSEANKELHFHGPV